MDGALAMAAEATASSELMEILMGEDELEAMGDLAVPVAAQISHSQIIEKQAQNIAKLEKQAARAHEYKTLTKVKLKEAAARLREYRLRVEALSHELEALKKQKQKPQDAGDGELVAAGRGGRGRGRGRGGRGRGRGAAVVAAVSVADGVGAAVERKTADVVSVAVQTDGEKVQTRTIAAQCDDATQARDAETQTELDLAAFTQPQQRVSAEDAALPARATTNDAAVQTQSEAKKTVTSGVQTVIVGDVQPVRAIPEIATCEVQTTVTGETQPVRQSTSVTAGFQTDPVACASFGCQCDLGVPVETVAKNLKEDANIVETGDLAQPLRSNEEEDAIPDCKAGVSRKRKRSFESVGRGEKPTPSALLASVAQVSGPKPGASMVQQLNDPLLFANTVANGVAPSMLDKDAPLDTIAARQVEESNDSDTRSAAALVKSQSPLATLVDTASAVLEIPPIEEVQHRKPASLERTQRPVGALLQPTMVESPENSPDGPLRVRESQIDAISAAIDAELEYSDSDEDDPDGDGASHLMQVAQSTTTASDGAPLRTVVAFDAAICNEIDKELDFSSSDDNGGNDDDASSSSSDDADDLSVQDTELRSSGVMDAGNIVGKMDAVSVAIDDELASISDEEEEDRVQQDSTLHVSVPISSSGVVSHDAISAAIDNELASSSDDEDDNLRDGATILPTSGAAIVDTVVGGQLTARRVDKDDCGPTNVHTVTSVAGVDHKDEIGAAIDDELASSSDDENTESEEIVPDSASCAPAQDAAAATVRIEEVTTPENKDNQPAISSPELQTLNAVVATDKEISALIDDELASSSDEGEQDAAIELIEKAVSPKPGDAVDTALADETEDAVDGKAISANRSGRALTTSRVPDSEVCEGDIANNGDKVVISEEDEGNEIKIARSSIVEAVASEDNGAVVSLYEIATGKLDASRSTVSYNRTDTAQSAEDEAVRQDFSRVSPDARIPTNGHADVETLTRTEMADAEKDATPVLSTAYKSDDPGKLSLSESSSSDESSDSDSSEPEHGDGDNRLGDAADAIEAEMASELKEPDQSTQATVAEDSGNVAGHDNDIPTANVQAISQNKPMTKLTAVQLALAAKRAVKAPSGSLVRDLDAPAQVEKPIVRKKRLRNESVGDKSDDARSSTTESDIAIEITETALSAPKSPIGSPLLAGSDINVPKSPVGGSLSANNDREVSEQDKYPKKKLKLADGDAVASATSSSSIVASGESDTTNTTDAEPIAKGVESIPEKVRAAIEMKADRLTTRTDAFKRTLTRAENKKDEKFDDQFVFRTLRILLSSCAKHAASQPEIVTALCDALVAHYHEKKVSPVVFIRGTCRMLRTPAAWGQVSETGSLGVGWLAHQILFGLVGGRVGDSDGTIQVSEAGRCWLDECLDYLQMLLFPSPTTRAEYAICAFSEADSKTQLQMIHLPRKNKVSKDKAYLGHVCSLFARICKSTDLNERLRVVAFDLLRRNPNIKGLYFTRAIVEVAPAILQVEFDSRGHEKVAVVKDAMQHALAVIEAQSARKEEVFYEESSLEIMHRILECIDAPSQQEINADDPAYRQALADKLWNTYITPRSAATWDEDGDATFQVCKSLELLTIVYDMDHVVELFPLRRFLDACKSSDDIKVKARITKMVGRIACALVESLRRKGTNDSAVAFVAEAAAWLQQELRAQATASPLGLEFQQVCASMCIDLIMASPMELPQRRDILHAVVSWFQEQPQQQQMRFPANFLRQLRLLTVASRPLSTSITAVANKAPKIAR